jgi:hypothetical protein
MTEEKWNSLDIRYGLESLAEGFLWGCFMLGAGIFAGCAVLALAIA